VRLVWQRRVRDWGRALSEEHRIKTLARAEKLAFIAASRPTRSDATPTHAAKPGPRKAQRRRPGRGVSRG
jgi:predicted GIY-YIG superfamily endonuclease